LREASGRHPLIQDQHPGVRANHKIGANWNYNECEPEITRAGGARGDEEGERIGENEREDCRDRSDPHASREDLEIIGRPTENPISEKLSEIIEREAPNNFPIGTPLHKGERNEERRREKQEDNKPQKRKREGNQTPVRQALARDEFAIVN